LVNLSFERFDYTFKKIIHKTKWEYLLICLCR
jgi:hypothetical protein